jgi:hypothetical protein
MEGSCCPSVFYTSKANVQISAKYGIREGGKEERIMLSEFDFGSYKSNINIIQREPQIGLFKFSQKRLSVEYTWFEICTQRNT